MFKKKEIIYFSLFALTLSIFFLGIENLSPFNTKWLHTGNDTTVFQVGWSFFKHDIWRFPLGSNPNYGIESGNSIVYTDSIPFLAIFFKIFKNFLPNSFQYFSLWIFFCFFFQGFFAYKIIFHYTKNNLYALVGCFFFIFAPTFLYRLGYHLALAAHWIILAAFYIQIVYEKSKLKIWIILLSFSILVNIYFTVMLFGIFILLNLPLLIKKNIKIKKFLFDSLLLITIILTISYIIGLFTIDLIDSLAVGYGIYKLNLLTILDPSNDTFFSWSKLLPDIKLTAAEEVEGFNFLGLGGLILLLFSLFILTEDVLIKKKIFKKNNLNISYILIFIIFTLYSISNNVDFGNIRILQINLNDYVYGVLSIFRQGGRFFWVPYYMIILTGIVLIYLRYGEKFSKIILSLILLIHIFDISESLKVYMFGNYFKEKSQLYELKDPIWQLNFIETKNLRTTYPVQNSNIIFPKTSYTLDMGLFKKTNIVRQARFSRSKTASARYKLYENFYKKKLLPNSIFVIDNEAHLRHLKYLLEKENVGFFYRDDMWLMIENKKSLMNSLDKEKLKSIKINKIDFNNKIYPEFNKKIYQGLGWSHNREMKGIWSDGERSTLMFLIDNNENDQYLNIEMLPFVNKKLDMEIYVNGKIENNYSFMNKDKNKLFLKKINLNTNNMKSNIAIIDFKYRNLTSPWELFESPDARKLGILIKSIELKKE